MCVCVYAGVWWPMAGSVSQCCSADSVVGFTDRSVAVVQSVPFSGKAFDELSVFGEFVAAITFVKVAEYDNQGIRICLLHTQNLVSVCWAF